MAAGLWDGSSGKICSEKIVLKKICSENQEGVQENAALLWAPELWRKHNLC